MAGSSTQSMENFSAQAMERHQIMMNTEVMKHFTIMNRASVRDIMLQHEKTFKEQVHDLHKLYEMQIFLMDRAKSSESDFYLPELSAHHLHTPPEEPNQLKQKSNFWEQVPTDGVVALKAGMSRRHPDTEAAVKEKTTLLEDKSKSSNSPVRKRKIDLEQLPEDETDDEMEKSENVPSLAMVNLTEKPKELTMAYTSHDTTIKSYSSPNYCTSAHPLQSAKPSQISSLVTGGNSSLENHASASRVASVYPLQYGKGPKLPLDVVKAEQTPKVNEEKNTAFQNDSVLSTDGGTDKTMAVFLPQTDLIDRVSQDSGRETHWFFQASDTSRNSLAAAEFSSQQRQKPMPHTLMQEPSFNEYHQHSGIPQGHQNLVVRHPNSKLVSMEDASRAVGNWSKPSGEKNPPGLAVGAQEGSLFSSSERPDNASRWFTTEAYLPGGQLASVVPAVGVDMRASEGGNATSGFVVPAVSILSGKGQNQELDTKLWYSQNPVVQLSQYQQQPIFRPQVFPSVNQPAWLQSPQHMHGGLYPHVVYGVHTTDASQVGFRAEGLQRGQGDINGPWNMVGLGHFYSSGPSVPQKPPFKKPPKLVLKNGVGMELRLVSPERDSSEKVSQRKLSNPSKDLPQESLIAQERKGGVQRQTKEEDIKHEEGVKSTGVKKQISTVQVGEAPKASSLSSQQKVPARTTASQTQDSLSPRDIPEHMTASIHVHHHGLAAPVTISSVAQSDTGAVANMESFRENEHNVIGASYTVSTLPNESEGPHGVHQAEMIMLQHDQLKTVGQNTHVRADVGINEDMQGLALSGQGSSLVSCKDDIEGTMTGCNNKSRDYRDSEHVQISTLSRKSEDMKSPSNSAPIPKGSIDNVNVTSQPSPVGVKSQDSLLKSWEESGHLASVKERIDEGLDVNNCPVIVLPKSKNETDAFRDDFNTRHGHANFDTSLSSVEYSQARADGFFLDSATDGHSVPGVATGSSRKDDAQTKSPLPGNMLRHGSDLMSTDLMSTSNQLTMQAVSTQSTSTDTPGIIKQERKCSSKALESSVPNKISRKGSSSSAHGSKLATLTSDKVYLSAPSVKPTTSQSKLDITVGDSSENLQHASDSDNLAATILLSFAPNIDLQNPKKHLKEDAGKTVGSGRKCRPAEHASSRTRQIPVGLTEDVTGFQSETFEYGDAQGSQPKVQCSSRRMDHHDPIRLAMKDRFREELRSSQLQSDYGSEEDIKNTRRKLPRAVSMGSPVDDLPMATSRSKQLNKLGAAMVNTKSVDTHAMSYKGKDVFHTPTGRRSSRGPPKASQVNHGSRGRSQKQSQHCSDEEGGSPGIAEASSRSREESGGNPSKLEGSMKSKAWSVQNRKRSRPRSQFHGISHRKTQR